MEEEEGKYVGQRIASRKGMRSNTKENTRKGETDWSEGQYEERWSKKLWDGAEIEGKPPGFKVCIVNLEDWSSATLQLKVRKIKVGRTLNAGRLSGRVPNRFETHGSVLEDHLGEGPSPADGGRGAS